MLYYIDTIEQVKGAGEGEINEYGSRTKKNSYETALTSYYASLSNVANDLISETTPDKNHYYLDIRIVDSTGGVLKKDKLGSLQNQA